jgi:dTDP-glucose 4,6-dehydratase
MKILVTGGCGFIGSNFIRYILKKYPDYEVINLDGLTYSGNLENLRDIKKDKRYHFKHGRIEDIDVVMDAIYSVDYVVHFAAETHVDRSIRDAQPFLITNILGTHIMLETARTTSVRKFIHISTDEVYGTLGDEGLFTEETPLKPNSPYSASKAAGDLLVHAYHETYGLPIVIVRPSNNYGHYQLPEKFIPLMITNLLSDKPIPVYGKGNNIRDWLFVEDSCAAIDTVMHYGRIGEVYNIGGNSEVRNIDLVRKVLKIIGKGEDYIKFVEDRPGHDYRYALDNSKIERELNWKPSVKIDEGLRMTVQWYVDNEWWWKPIKERFGAESKGFWEGQPKYRR